MRYFNLALLLIFLGACAAPPGSNIIQLSDLQPLPANPQTAVMPLRVAVAAVISPQGTAESYRPFLDYVGAQLGRPVELVQRRTYAEINDLLESGEVDVAFVCTSAYIVGHSEFGMTLLVAPQVNGETRYHSLLIVPAISQAQTLADLRGKTFAFTDPMSNSGRIYPSYLVKQLGSTPEVFFGRTFYTYSHDDAIRAVADRLADGAAVDSLVYQFAIQRDPTLADRVRVIHTSPPFGIPPVVVSPALRPQLYADLQNLLLMLNDNSTGQAALAAMGVERFVRIDDAAYDSVRDLMTQARQTQP